MAVIATPVSSDLILVMDNGIGASGQPLSTKRTYRNIKITASDEDLHAVAQGLIGLQTRTNLMIQRNNTVELTAE